MSKTILVVLIGPEGAEACLRAADAAVRFLVGAAIKVLHVRIDPLSTILPSEEIMTGDRQAELERKGADESRVVHAVFDAWQAERASPANVNWQEVVGTEDAAVTRFGKLASLITVRRPGPTATKPVHEAFHAAVFETKQPVLMIPSRAATDFGHRVLVAWKDNKTTRRAIDSAVPMLSQAAQVIVVQVCEEGAGELVEAEKLFSHHEIKAEFIRLTPDKRPVGERLLAEASDRGCDCLVMGAYRHNPLIEMILGGATKEVIGHAELPVFMQH